MAEPTTSFDTAPRLQPTVADPTAAYVPIAWSAVTALLIGILFVVVLGGYAVASYFLRQPLIAPWLFLPALIGVAVAFAARRSVVASEGTRTGTRYAAAGWWLCVVGGLVYAAYLGALEYTIRADAEGEFRKWTDQLAEANPEAADDEALFAAFYQSLPANVRASLNETADPQVRKTLRDRFGQQLMKFRQSGIVQQVARNRGQCKFTSQGLQEWKYQSKKIESVLSVLLTTPEGDFPLVVPMDATVEGGKREWQVGVRESNGSPTQPSVRTRYGHLVGGWVPQSARAFVTDAIGRQRDHSMTQRFLSHPAFAAGVGGVAGLPWPPLPEQQPLFAGPFLVPSPGATASDDKLRMFRRAWEEEPAQRFGMGGILPEGAAESADAPVIDVNDVRIQVKMPVQYKPKGLEAAQSGVRARLVVECADPALVKEIAAARASAAADPRTTEVPADLPKRTIPWRLVRFESDLEEIRPPAPTQGRPGGGPGGMGG